MKKNILYVGNILSEFGFSVTTIETLGRQLEEEGFSLIYTSSKLKMPSRLLDMVLTLIKNRKTINQVLIDTYSKRAFWYTYVVSQVARILKVPYIPILHGGNLPDRLHKSPFFCRQIFLNSKVNISPSKYLQVAFKEQGLNSIYIPNNINIQDYEFTERKHCDPKLLFVRSFDKIYNPKMGINVLNKVLKVYPNTELCMVGPDKDGSLQECKDLAAKLGISQNVKFTGKLNKEEWHKLSEDYYIFINTTNIDNMPVSIIEAMALGLPIVSTKAGGIPYLLENEKEALLVDLGDVDMMTSAVIKLVKEDVKAHRFSLIGRNKAEDFDWEVVKYKWHKVLKNKSSKLNYNE